MGVLIEIWENESTIHMQRLVVEMGNGAKRNSLYGLRDTPALEHLPQYLLSKYWRSFTDFGTEYFGMAYLGFLR